MTEAPENFEDFNLLHKTSIRLPKDRFHIKEIGYEDEEDVFSINIGYHDMGEMIKTSQNLSFVNLFGRALARARLNEQLKSVWTFISQQDLEKTNAKPEFSLFEQIGRNIKNLSPNQPVAVVLWQDKEKVFGLIIFEDEKSETFGPYKNFSEGEINIQDKLKEILK